MTAARRGELYIQVLDAVGMLLVSLTYRGNAGCAAATMAHCWVGLVPLRALAGEDVGFDGYRCRSMACVFLRRQCCGCRL
jgi:hypothetical protein